MRRLLRSFALWILRTYPDSEQTDERGEAAMQRLEAADRRLDGIVRTACVESGVAYESDDQALSFKLHEVLIHAWRMKLGRTPSTIQDVKDLLS